MAVYSLLSDRFPKIKSPFYTNDVKTPAQIVQEKIIFPGMSKCQTGRGKMIW